MRKKYIWKPNESFICSGGQGLGGKIIYFNKRKGKSWGRAKCSSTEGIIFSMICFIYGMNNLLSYELYFHNVCNNSCFSVIWIKGAGHWRRYKVHTVVCQHHSERPSNSTGTNSQPNFWLPLIYLHWTRNTSTGINGFRPQNSPDLWCSYVY